MVDNNNTPISWYCYVLKSVNCNKTYNGSTNDLKRRLRQHNGELAGGAKATQIGRPYEIICTISGFSNHQKALSCEWWIRHPTGSRMRPSQYTKPNGRIKGIDFLFQSQIWKEKFSDEKLVCDIQEIYKQYIQHIPNNVELKIIKN